LKWTRLLIRRGYTPYEADRGRDGEEGSADILTHEPVLEENKLGIELNKTTWARAANNHRLSGV